MRAILLQPKIHAVFFRQISQPFGRAVTVWQVGSGDEDRAAKSGYRKRFAQMLGFVTGWKLFKNYTN